MDIKINEDPGFEIPGDNPQEINRHIFKKGRHEAMGGPTFYTQGHGYGPYKNQNRIHGFPPSGRFRDAVADELGVDDQE